ncbi:hypothetical protein DFJ73DRAFT_965750 [Zopfochytrium polystomum]|nr:hypothetical protein DFJ73DRAFT_965750 [Zopfochytrium polystomum]
MIRRPLRDQPAALSDGIFNLFQKQPAAATRPSTHDTAAKIREDFLFALIYIVATAITDRTDDPRTRHWMFRTLVDVVKRSRSSFNDLQLALLYFVRLRKAAGHDSVSTPQAPSQTKSIHVLLRERSPQLHHHDHCPSNPCHSHHHQVATPPISPAADTTTTYVVAPHSPLGAIPLSATPPPLPPTPPPPTPFTYHTFLACLILARKYQHDTHFNNRAWSVITQVPLSAIDAAERRALAGLDYALAVDGRVGADGTTAFARFCAVPVAAAMRLVDVRARVERVKEASAAAAGRKRGREEAEKEVESDGFLEAGFLKRRAI